MLASAQKTYNHEKARENACKLSRNSDILLLLLAAVNEQLVYSKLTDYTARVFSLQSDLKKTISQRKKNKYFEKSII